MELDIKKTKLLISCLRSLKHPLNIKIITLLEKAKELDVNSIVMGVGIAQPVVSHYLIEMKTRGILISERRKQKIFYSINPDLIKNMNQDLKEFIHLDYQK